MRFTTTLCTLSRGRSLSIVERNSVNRLMCTPPPLPNPNRLPFSGSCVCRYPKWSWNGVFSFLLQVSLFMHFKRIIPAMRRLRRAGVAISRLVDQCGRQHLCKGTRGWLGRGFLQLPILATSYKGWEARLYVLCFGFFFRGAGSQLHGFCHRITLNKCYIKRRHRCHVPPPPLFWSHPHRKPQSMTRTLALCKTINLGEKSMFE